MMDRNFLEAERNWLETPRTQDEEDEIYERKQAKMENDFEEQRLHEIEER